MSSSVERRQVGEPCRFSSYRSLVERLQVEAPFHLVPFLEERQRAQMSRQQERQVLRVSQVLRVPQT
jgi:hypothetical protein|tara:strand:- start:892 stop:1092 length:201 start_codon:yes stop_codon:yes gene_type:complete